MAAFFITSISCLSLISVLLTNAIVHIVIIVICRTRVACVSYTVPLVFYVMPE